ncbi:MAG: HAD family phosphatase [Bacteroidia bacterium]|nr:HAD family phosphatase [Bacteroidia bacterium]MCF8425719.1 HAD family phosphatase [Bacteroidia bacterium]MCF8448067.1 HAD family phosphatase [Bacteroidia bacterium]
MAIKNIIFDLGAVVLNLDQEKTLRAFRRLGADLDELNYESSLFIDYEVGKIDTEFFLHSLMSRLKGNASKEQLIDAWNAMLLDLPPKRIELLRQIKKKYRLFLLSNTNNLHIEAVYKEHGKEIFEELFEKIYLSQEIGLRKPNVECYHYVLKDAGIKGSESVFVDDNRANIKGADEAGINTIWAKEPLDKWFGIELKKVDVLQVN